MAGSGSVGLEELAGVVNLRCVLVGDSGVGKSTLLRALAGLPPPASTKSTGGGGLADSVTIMVDLPAGGAKKSQTDPVKVRLRLDDTPGTEGMDLLRPRLYADAGAFLLCCSAAEATSADRLLTRWLPEVSRHQPGLPCLILVMQSDRPSRSALSAVKRVTEALGNHHHGDVKLLTKCSATQWQPGGLEETRLLTRLARLALPVPLKEAQHSEPTGRQSKSKKNAHGAFSGMCCFSTRSSTLVG